MEATHIPAIIANTLVAEILGFNGWIMAMYLQEINIFATLFFDFETCMGSQRLLIYIQLYQCPFF